MGAPGFVYGVRVQPAFFDADRVWQEFLVPSNVNGLII
jgi:hypothetical protein